MRVITLSALCLTCVAAAVVADDDPAPGRMQSVDITGLQKKMVVPFAVHTTDLSSIVWQSRPDLKFKTLRVKLDGDKDSGRHVGVFVREVMVLKKGVPLYPDETKLDHVAVFTGVKSGNLLVTLTPVDEAGKELPSKQVEIKFVEKKAKK